MDEEPREIELKFALPRERAEALLSEFPDLARAAARPLSSVYFDTDKRSLRRAGLALRVRREDGQFVQTLKNAGDGAYARGEWEAPLAGPEPALAPLEKTPAERVLGKGARLAAQFAVNVARRSAEVEEAGARVELSLDQGEAKAGDKRAPFAELELELKGGEVGGLFALARKLASAGDLTLSFTTKAERGFALAGRQRARALRFEPPRLTHKTTAAEAFRAAAKACLRQVVGNAEALRERASPEVVHQLRVGARRLRSVMTIFKKVVADARLPALKAELKWLAGELDAARNLDVLLHGDYRASLTEKDQAGGLKRLGARLRDARRIAYARGAAAVESERFRRLVLDLLIWIEVGPWSGEAGDAAARDQLVARLAEKQLERRRRKVIKRGRHLARLAPAARHKLRIDAKKLRYGAELFAGLYHRRKRARRFIEALKAAQDRLGELNDLVVGDTIAHEVGAGGGLAEPEAAYVAGRITGARKGRMARLLGEAQDGLGGLARIVPPW
jgi:triphosphatase